jgi:uncharacterized SAM-binding protein YcdF (DUF218 family)
MVLRLRIILFGVLIVLVFMFIGSCRKTGLWLVREDVPMHADAMILLMGPFPERVLQVADLYHEGITDNLIIVYESMGAYQALEERGATIIRTTEQARDAAVALGMPDSCITMLPGDARSTLDEALAVCDYLAMQPGPDTLILVSSPAHMRRAYMIFKTVLKKANLNTYVGCSPSKYSSFNPDRWWRRKEDIQSVLSELIKILNFKIIEQGKALVSN